MSRQDTDHRLRSELLAVNSDAAALCEGLSDVELAWRPHPGRWSIAENLAHLRITAETFLPVVDDAIAETRRRGLFGAGPFRLGWYGRLLVWYVEPPPAIRLPAPKLLRPVPGVDSSRVLDDFLAAQAKVRARMESASDLDLTALRFGSPLAKFVRMNLLEFFSVYNGHSRRRLWQARNVKNTLVSGSGNAPAPAT